MPVSLLIILTCWMKQAKLKCLVVLFGLLQINEQKLKSIQSFVVILSLVRGV